MSRTEVTFTDLLERLDNGAFSGDVEEELRKEVAAVQESGKTGRLTLNIKIKPASDGNDKQLLFKPSTKRKDPKPTRPASFLYADGDARLHGSDPDQVEMDLKQAPAEERAPLRRVETGS